jgi:hypothetical protein
MRSIGPRFACGTRSRERRERRGARVTRAALRRKLDRVKLTSSHESGRVSPVALIALAVLLVGLAAWASSWHALPKLPAFGGARAGGSASPPDTSSDAVIDRALAIAGADSARMRAKWHDDVRDMDLTPLDHKQRDVFLRFANAERCTCGCGFSLAGCRASDMTCETSGPRLSALLDSVRSGSLRNANGLGSRP